MGIVGQLLGLFFISFGVIFSLFGVVGILRFPDTYSRLHATGKIGTLGVIGLCIGVAFLMPETTLKLIVLSIFIIFSGPVTSHAIAAATKRKEALEEAETSLEQARRAEGRTNHSP